MKTKFFLVFTILLLSSCASTQYEEQQTNTLSYDTYKAKSALASGRVDVAQTVVNDMSIYVTPPKTPVTVYAVSGYAVLPDSYNKLKVIYYSDLLKNKTLSTELSTEKTQATKDLSDAQAQVKQDETVQDGLIKQVNTLKQQQTAYQNSWPYKIYAFFRSTAWIIGICSLLSVGGLIALCVMCPAVIPIVITIVEHIGIVIITVVYSIFRSIITFVGWVITKL